MAIKIEAASRLAVTAAEGTTIEVDIEDLGYISELEQMWPKLKFTAQPYRPRQGRPSESMTITGTRDELLRFMTHKNGYGMSSNDVLHDYQELKK